MNKLVLNIRPLALSIHLAYSSIALLYSTQVSANDITYNIKSGTLGRVLNEFSLQSGIKISMNAEQIAGLSSSGLKGAYDVEHGFEEILKNTSLQYIKTDNGYILTPKGKTNSEKAISNTSQLQSTDTSAVEQESISKLPVIHSQAKNTSDNNNGYLVKNTTGIGLWNNRAIIDTPYSVSVIPNDLIENSLAKDMNQIFKLSPSTQERGQSSSNVGDVQWPNIRGFRVQNPIVNGIPYANYISSVPMMQDIDRVEIINGATGFLYGGGRVGGAINYITKKPTAENLKDVTLGSYSNKSYYGHVDLGGHFDDQKIFGYRTNIMYQDGELSNTSETEQKAISLVFDWKPTDNFYTDVKYSYKNVLRKGINSFFVSIDDRSSIKDNKSYNPDWLQNEIKSNRFENNIKWKINDIFTLRTNAFYEKLRYRGDVSWITYNNNRVVGGKTNLYKYDWEETENNGLNVFLDSSFDTGNIQHLLTLGYSINTSKLSIRDNNYNGYQISQDITLNELKNLAMPAPSLWSRSSAAGHLKPNSKKEYHNVLLGDDIRINEKWSALAGVNYATVINKTYSTNTEYNKSKLTPTVSLIYKPIKNLSTYATYIEGLEAGTVVSSQYSNANEILPPLLSKQYEIGAKYSLNDDMLLTMALFNIEKANQYSNLETPIPKYVQDGKQVHKGIELGFTGKVTDSLTLIGGLTLMDIAVEKSNNKSLEGKKPTEVASKMAKLYAEYSFSSIEGLSLTGGAFYTGKKYANGLNTDILPAYTLYDLGFRYTSTIGKYPTTYNLNIQNLTNKTYWTNSWQLGDPRSVAFSVKTKF